MKFAKMTILPIALILLTMLISTATVKAGGITLITPKDFEKCVPIIDGKLLFEWTFLNPNNNTISDVTIKILQRYPEPATEVFSKLLYFDAATNFDYNFENGVLETDVLYIWQISAKFNGVEVNSQKFEFAIGVVPTFNEELSLENGANCVDLQPVFDWTQTTFSDYNFNMQLSADADFEELITVKRVNDEVATVAIPTEKLEPNTTYFWRLQNETCTSIFSTVRTFTTKLLAPEIISPRNWGFGDQYFTENYESILLVWEDENPGNSEIFYELQVALNPNFTVAQILLDTVVQDLEFEFIFSDWTDNFHDRYFYWRVRVIDSTDVENVCFSDWTAMNVFRTPLKPVKPISPINSANCVQKNATFTWEIVENVPQFFQFFHILISTSEDFSDTVEFVGVSREGSENTTHSTVIPLPENTTKYFWKIRQCRVEPINFSLWSEVHSFTTTIPATTLVFPANNQRGIEENVTLKWNKYSTVIGEEYDDEKNYSYRVQVARTNNFVNLLANVITSDTSYFFELLPNVSDYFWRVELIEEDGCRSFSDIFYFSSSLEIPVIIAPGKPHSVTPITVLPTNNVVFRWQTVPNANKYDIEYTKNIAAFDNIPNDVTFRYNIVLDTFTVLLDTNETYFWRIRAKYDNNENVTLRTSDWSEIYRFKTGFHQPTAPTLVAPANGATFVSTLPTFRWNRAAFAQEYILLISENSALSEIVIKVEISDTIFYIDNGISELELEVGTKYYWSVVAVNRGVESDLLQIWSFTTVPVPPTVAVELLLPVNNSTTVAGNNAFFSWNSISDIQFYQFQISKNSNFATPVIDEKITNRTHHQVTNLDENTKYYWRVAGGNENGLGVWSEVREFTTINTSILDNNFTSFMNIAPNPVIGNSAVCNFGLLQNANITVMLIDGIGNEIYSENFDFSAGEHSVHLNTQNLASGIYICKIISGDRIIGTVQFIIAK